MSKPRIEPLEPPYAEGIAEQLEAMMPPGADPIKLFRTLAHNERILGKIRHSNLLDRGSIERRDRELVILRVCGRCGAEYEWGVHVSFFAPRFGITEEEVAATVDSDWQSGPWSPRDRLLVRLVDELHDRAQISDELWTELAEHWSHEQLIELIVLAGFYHTISFVVNGLQIELEEGMATFPASAKRESAVA